MQQGGDILSFTWQSFAFTILNFLILVGLLWWFLHKPLLRILDRRKEEVEEMRADAEKKSKEAEQERQEYEKRKRELEEQREEILKEAREKAEEEHQEVLEEAREQGRQEVEELEEDWERRRREKLEALQAEVLDLVVDLGRRMMGQLTGEDVEDRLHSLLAERLEGLSLEQSGVGGEAEDSGERKVEVTSARRLEEQERGEIREMIEEKTGGEVAIAFGVEEDLIAGIRVAFSSRVVDATLGGLMEGLRERLAEVAPSVRGTEEERERQEEQDHSP